MKDKILGLFTGTIGGMLSWLFGTWDLPIKILITCMGTDYIMGILCGYKNKNVSSSIGFAGLKKKFSILLILILAVLLDRLMNQGWIFRTVVCYFYVAMEGISIIENAAVLGVPVPEKLKDALIQLKDGKKVVKKEE
ncbi:phage holin family protein [Clostridium thermarum]|uniref:phage holin family protein n=1 Tax=Clostridium thermarum TaxID=1716543 RepID=UPI00111D411F|nr:phage holin family protein [Clostridium thermarum]